MGAEDFSYTLQAKPGRTCASARARPMAATNSRYDFNDDILPLGAALHVGLVEQGLPMTAPESN